MLDGTKLFAVQPAKRRVVMISVCLNERITKNDEAYEALLDALVYVHKSCTHLRDDDLICYNIGSPLLHAFLNTDQ